MHTYSYFHIIRRSHDMSDSKTTYLVIIININIKHRCLEVVSYYTVINLVHLYL